MCVCGVSRKSAVSGMSHLQYEENILQHEESVHVSREHL